MAITLLVCEGTPSDHTINSCASTITYETRPDGDRLPSLRPPRRSPRAVHREGIAFEPATPEHHYGGTCPENGTGGGQGEGG